MTGDNFLSQHSLQPARNLRSNVDAYPRVLVAILAKQKEQALPLFLRCIEGLDYPKSSIVLYVRTNNNTDRTEQILREWIAGVGPSYAEVEFDATPVVEPVETFGQHEWNETRFRVLGNIRNVSLAKTAEHACDFYFVCDVDNFIRPSTLRELVALKLPIVAPLLRVTDPNGYYSNFFAEIDGSGFYGDCDQYQWILQQRVRGVFEVPLVHCTYLIRADIIPRLSYLDGSDRYEFVAFSDGARKAGIQQYIDNRQVYGYITFDAESNAATGIVGDQRHDQIAFARREIERQRGQKLSIQESSRDTMPTISVMAPRRPSNDFANGFNELSETIFYGLRHLGYHARIVSRLSEADGQIIVVGANTLSHEEAMQLPAGTVIYNAEPCPQVWQVFPRYADEVLRKYKVWDYNPENAKRLSASLGKAVEYVPLGYVPELTRIEKTDPEDIDVLFYGTVNARRRTILDRLEATGLKVNILCGVFGTERNGWIARSKVVLNVHSHEPGVFEIVRVAFLLANAKAVVSECNPGYAGEAVDADLLPGIVAAKYDDLVEACVSLVADDDRRHAIEQAGFAAIQARRASDILKNALAGNTSEGLHVARSLEAESLSATDPDSETVEPYNGRDRMRHRGIPYLDLMGVLSASLVPASYLEIGTATGGSLARFSCDAICVDPAFHLAENPVGRRARTHFFQMTSDTFFAAQDVFQIFPNGIDVSFIDGMHHFEFLLRDFINIERYCHTRSLILLHDCLPVNMRMAEREWLSDAQEDEETRGWWTGDVWRLLPVLKKYRPDLRVQILDCPPTGLTVCTRVDHTSRSPFR